VPIAWEELVELESGQQWTVRNLAQRLADTPRDPWAGYERSRQSIARAVATLAR
jgi:bifunctional non-homologous end joining protein LigD